VRNRPVTLPAMRRRLLTVCLLIVLGAAGACSGHGKKSGGTVSPTAPAAPAAVTVKAHEYGFDAPAEVEGGVVALTLQNDGKLKHEAVVVAAGDTPLDTLKHDLGPVVKGAGQPTPGYLGFRGGVSLVAAGTSATQTLTLPPGRYVFVCTLTDADSSGDAAGSAPAADQQFHYDRGMAAPFTVKAANTATMPATDGTVVARDYAFDVPPLSAGAKNLTLRNDGQQDHSLAVAEFGEGIDAAAAKAAFDQFLAADAEQRDPPDNLPVPTDVAFAGPLSAGAQATFTVPLKPNRTYVFACYMSDRAGGPVHASGKGMVAYVPVPPG
jgi:uncharacterized cupredoxin-like copper-binding protein